MKGCLTETTTCVVAKPLVVINSLLYKKDGENKVIKMLGPPKNPQTAVCCAYGYGGTFFGVILLLSYVSSIIQASLQNG